MLPCSGNKIDFGSRNNNHHLQSASAEETFIAAFTDNDQYFSLPPVLKVCSTVASQNRRVQEGRACLGPRKHRVGPRLCRAGSLYLRACLKRPGLNQIQHTVFVFSARQEQKRVFWGKTGGKHNLFFYFAPTEHCSGANCRLFFVVWQQLNRLVADYCLFLLFFCEFYFHRDTFISVMYHKGSRKPIQTFVFTLLTSPSNSSELLRSNYHGC